MNKYSIMLVDDHPLIVAGNVNIAQETPDFEVIATASNGQAALKQLANLTDQLDLLIFDYSMPQMDGNEFLNELNRQNYTFRKMLLTTVEEPAIFEKMLHSGLDGIVLKTAPVAEILSTAKFLIENPQSTVVGTEVKNLTKARENPLVELDSQILTLIAEGKHVKEIAQQMSFSERAIKYHLTEIYNQLGAVNRAQAVAIAISKHWIKL